MILVVITNGTFVIDTSLCHAPITLMLDGKVITHTVRKRIFDGVAEMSQTNNNKMMRTLVWPSMANCSQTMLEGSSDQTLTEEQKHGQCDICSFIKLVDYSTFK